MWPDREPSWDARLFHKINGGNCASLPLNNGYGWAGSINLEYILKIVCRPGGGAGYPKERAESQK